MRKHKRKRTRKRGNRKARSIPSNDVKDWSEWSRLNTVSTLANPDHIPTTPDFEAYKPTTLQETHMMHKWEELRREYTNKTGRTYCVALAELPSTRRSKRHDALTKAESSALTQLRIEWIGLNSFLNKMHVPGFTSKQCPCGFQNYTGKHLLILCPEQERSTLFKKGGTRDYRELLDSRRGAKAAAKWLINTGILEQFRLAQDLTPQILT